MSLQLKMSQIKKFMGRFSTLTACALTMFLLPGCANVSMFARQGNNNQLKQGATIGHTYFADGDTPSGGQGQPVDGIKAEYMEKLSYHIHAHLSLFDNGRQIAIPRGIGIVPPRTVQNGFVTNGSSFYWLHTHDASGIIHIESPVKRQYTLGNFFAIWGKPLSQKDVAGFQGVVHVYIDGKPYNGEIGLIPLTAHEEITIEVGTPIVKPPTYIFPKGL